MKPDLLGAGLPIALAWLTLCGPADAASHSLTPRASYPASVSAAQTPATERNRSENAPTGPDQDPAIDQLAREIAAKLRCPVCQGLSIQDSPTELAREMHALIREKLHAGESPDQVKAYFISKYGEWVLLEPDPRGFNLAVYLLPFAALLVGLGIIATAVRRWTRTPAASTSSSAHLSD